MFPFDDVTRSYIAAVPVSHRSISKITQTFVKFKKPQITNSFHKHFNGHWNMNWIGVVYMVCFSLKTKSYINQCHDSAENRSMQKRRAYLPQNLICKSVSQEYSMKQTGLNKFSVWMTNCGTYMFNELSRGVMLKPRKYLLVDYGPMPPCGFGVLCEHWSSGPFY